MEAVLLTCSPLSLSEEKWLINQNIFVKTKEWRLRDKNGNTLGRREINKTASRTAMNRKVMLMLMLGWV